MLLARCTVFTMQSRTVLKKFSQPHQCFTLSKHCSLPHNVLQSTGEDSSAQVSAPMSPYFLLFLWCSKFSSPREFSTTPISLLIWKSTLKGLKVTDALVDSDEISTPLLPRWILQLEERVQGMRRWGKGEEEGREEGERGISREWGGMGNCCLCVNRPRLLRVYN